MLRFAALLLLMIPNVASGQDDVSERPEAFVRLREVAPTVLQDVRYHRTYNFVGDSIDGYEAPACWLTRPAAVALKEVQDRLRPMGLSLKVFDCYRPQRAVNHFVRWARDTGDTRMKDAFYPEEPKRTLFSRGYIASRSGHSRGSTIDLTIARADAAPQPPDVPACPGSGSWQPTEGELDMGTGFDCFSSASATASEQVTPEQRAHRLLLKALMTDHGFRNYSREWWHYTFHREPFPNTYFDFPVE